MTYGGWLMADGSDVWLYSQSPYSLGRYGYDLWLMADDLWLMARTACQA